MVDTVIPHSFHCLYHPKAFKLSHSGLQPQQLSLHVTYQQFQANKTLALWATKLPLPYFRDFKQKRAENNNCRLGTWEHLVGLRGASWTKNNVMWIKCVCSNLEQIQDFSEFGRRQTWSPWQESAFSELTFITVSIKAFRNISTGSSRLQTWTSSLLLLPNTANIVSTETEKNAHFIYQF